MRYVLILAATPLALLAGCAKSTPADEATPEPMVAATETEAPVPVKLPTVPVNAVTTIDYPGTYSRGTETLRLSSDKNYVLTLPDGTVRTGSYTELADHQRIKLNNFEDGKPAWFSIANGAIYRLKNENTSPNEITVTAEYKREPDVPPATPVTPEIASPVPSGG